jgi:hypothetical protein
MNFSVGNASENMMLSSAELAQDFAEGFVRQ